MTQTPQSLNFTKHANWRLSDSLFIYFWLYSLRVLRILGYLRLLRDLRIFGDFRDVLILRNLCILHDLRVL